MGCWDCEQSDYPEPAKVTTPIPFWRCLAVFCEEQRSRASPVIPCNYMMLLDLCISVLYNWQS